VVAVAEQHVGMLGSAITVNAAVWNAWHIGCVGGAVLRCRRIPRTAGGNMAVASSAYEVIDIGRGQMSWRMGL